MSEDKKHAIIIAITAENNTDENGGNSENLQRHELDHLKLIELLGFLGGGISFDGPADIIYELTPNCEWCGELFCACAEMESWVQGDLCPSSEGDGDPGLVTQ